MIRRRRDRSGDYGSAGVTTNAPWRAGAYCVIDVETTGLDAKTDAILSYGCVPVDDGRAVVGDSRYSLVRPARTADTASVTVHGLRTVDLQYAPDSNAAATALMQALTGRVLVAHAAWIEVGFLDRLFRTVGRRLRPEVIDTAAMAKAAGLPGVEGRAPSLELLSMKLSLPVHTPHHALGDALTTAQLFLVLAHRLSATAPVTVKDLIRLD